MLRSRVRAWLARTRSDSPVAEVQPDATEVDDSPELQRTEQTYIEALSKTNLFRHLDLTQLQNLVSSASEQVFPSGYEVLREGEPGTSVFIILSGAVRIVEAVAEGPESMFLTEMRAGDLFGAIGFLRNGPRSATVVTLERTRCLVLAQKEFLETLDSSPTLSIALLRVLAGRLADANRLLARYALDPLTGLPRRRAFSELYQRLASGARRRSSGVLLLLMDVQNLREINDEYGYGVGDEVLKGMAEALMESSRTTDLIARYGSDEFVVLLIDAQASDCDVIIERVNAKLMQLVARKTLPVPVRYDVGIAVSAEAPEKVEPLLRVAEDDAKKKNEKSQTAG